MIDTLIHMVGINSQLRVKMMKLFILLVMLSLSLNVDSKSILKDLEVPKELKKEVFTTLYSKIPSAETGTLFLIEYKSLERKKTKEKYQIATDIITGKKKKVLVKQFEGNGEYGVRFWFTDSECSVNKGYVFVLDSSKWILDDLIKEFPSINCTK